MSATLDLAKRRRALNIRANDDRINAAANRMRPSLERWLAKATERFANDEIKAMRQREKNRKKLRKRKSMAELYEMPTREEFLRLQKAAPSDAEIRQELERILVTFGVRDVDAAGKDMAARLDSDWKVTPRILDLITRQKQAKIQQLTGQTKRRVRDQVRKVISTALRESPRPSISEIARRIRVQVVELPPLKGAKNPELVARANRAEMIARTEAGQAENTGIREGMIAAGIDEIEWLAHGNDGRSGKRQHWKMNGKRISLEASRGSDRSEWFLTPLGNRLRYPLDPSGPIADVARCRCTILPVVHKGKRKISPGRGKPHGVRDGAAGEFG